MWNTYVQTTPIEETLAILKKNNANARIINGGTDLLLELEHKFVQPMVIIDISRIPGLDGINYENGWIHIGANVTHNQAAGSSLLREYISPS